MPTGLLPTNGKRCVTETIGLYYHLSETSPPGPQRAQTPAACFYSPPLAVSAEWYSPHYLQKKQLIRIWFAHTVLSLYVERVSPSLLVSSHGIYSGIPEHLLVSTKNYFLVWKVVPLTWWGGGKSDATSVLYVNQSEHCQLLKLLLSQPRYIAVQITSPTSWGVAVINYRWGYGAACCSEKAAVRLCFCLFCCFYRLIIMYTGQHFPQALSSVKAPFSAAWVWL